MRSSEIKRKTAETDISLKLDIDGSGKFDIDTGSGFFNHMLELFTRHGRFDMTVHCDGDIEVDYHHTVEDIGIVMGQAFKFGTMKVFDGSSDVRSMMAGSFDSELAEEFLVAFSRELGLTLHVKKIHGKNTHHIIEGIFKGLARALAAACEIDEKFADEIPSTKGSL